jgi:hypothetical protein
MRTSAIAQCEKFPQAAGGKISAKFREVLKPTQFRLTFSSPIGKFREIREMREFHFGQDEQDEQDGPMVAFNGFPISPVRPARESLWHSLSEGKVLCGVKPPLSPPGREDPKTTLD